MDIEQHEFHNEKHNTNNNNNNNNKQTKQNKTKQKRKNRKWELLVFHSFLQNLCVNLIKNHRRMGHGFRFLLPPFLYYPPPFFKIFI